MMGSRFLTALNGTLPDISQLSNLNPPSYPGDSLKPSENDLSRRDSRPFARSKGPIRPLTLPR